MGSEKAKNVTRCRLQLYIAHLSTEIVCYSVVLSISRFFFFVIFLVSFQNTQLTEPQIFKFPSKSFANKFLRISSILRTANLFQFLPDFHPTVTQKKMQNEFSPFVFTSCNANAKKTNKNAWCVILIFFLFPYFCCPLLICILVLDRYFRWLVEQSKTETKT